MTIIKRTEGREKYDVTVWQMRQWFDRGNLTKCGPFSVYEEELALLTGRDIYLGPRAKFRHEPRILVFKETPEYGARDRDHMTAGAAALKLGVSRQQVYAYTKKKMIIRLGTNKYCAKSVETCRVFLDRCAGNSRVRAFGRPSNPIKNHHFIA